MKKIKLRFPELLGSPSYQLQESFSIGTKDTDLVLSHPSISTKHATLFYEEDMLFVIDHNSEQGIKVNGQLIEPNRRILLEEDDVLHFGQVKMKFEIVDDVMAQMEDRSVSQLIKLQEIIGNENKGPHTSPIAQGLTQSKKIPPPQNSKAKNSKSLLSKVKLRKDYDRNANSFVRLIALIVDISFALGLGNILKQDEGFKSFLVSLTENLAELITFVHKEHLQVIFKTVQFLLDAITDVMIFLNQEFNFLEILVVTGLFRIVTTIIFGISFGQLMIGIQTHGPFILKRIMGVWRKCLGFVFGPLLIFDFSALLGHRTLKEFLSFTKLVCPSYLTTTVLSLIFIPISLGFFLIAPLINIYSENSVVSMAERKWKKPSWAQEISQSSQHLHFSMPSSASDWWLFPRMNIYPSKKKSEFLPSIEIVSLAGEVRAELSLVKSFSMNKMIGKALKNQWMLQKKFPELTAQLLSKKIENPEFKNELDPEKKKAYINELKKLFSLSFKLDLETWMLDPAEFGYIINGLHQFRESFFELVGYPQNLDGEWINSEVNYLVSVSFNQPSVFDYLVPLDDKDQGRVYRLDLPKENANKFRKVLSDNFLGAIQFKSHEVPNENFPSALSVVDALVNLQKPEGIKDIPLIYTYYFFQAQNILKLNNPSIENSFRLSLELTQRYLEKYKAKPDIEGLYAKIAEINVAFQNKQIDYFVPPSSKQGKK